MPSIQNDYEDEEDSFEPVFCIRPKVGNHNRKAGSKRYSCRFRRSHFVTRQTPLEAGGGGGTGNDEKSMLSDFLPSRDILYSQNKKGRWNLADKLHAEGSTMLASTKTDGKLSILKQGLLNGYCLSLPPVDPNRHLHPWDPLHRMTTQFFPTTSYTEFSAITTTTTQNSHVDTATDIERTDRSSRVGQAHERDLITNPASTSNTNKNSKKPGLRLSRRRHHHAIIPTHAENTATPQEDHNEENSVALPHTRCRFLSPVVSKRKDHRLPRQVARMESYYSGAPDPRVDNPKYLRVVARARRHELDMLDDRVDTVLKPRVKKSKSGRNRPHREPRSEIIGTYYTIQHRRNRRRGQKQPQEEDDSSSTTRSNSSSSFNDTKETSMEFHEAPFLLSNAQLNPRFLQKHFAESYLECSVSPRRFLIDISRRVRHVMEVSHGCQTAKERLVDVALAFRVSQDVTAHYENHRDRDKLQAILRGMNEEESENDEDEDETEIYSNGKVWIIGNVHEHMAYHDIQVEVGEHEDDLFDLVKQATVLLGTLPVRLFPLKNQESVVRRPRRGTLPDVIQSKLALPQRMFSHATSQSVLLKEASDALLLNLSAQTDSGVSSDDEEDGYSQQEKGVSTTSGDDSFDRLDKDDEEEVKLARWKPSADDGEDFFSPIANLFSHNEPLQTGSWNGGWTWNNNQPPMLTPECVVCFEETDDGFKLNGCSSSSSSPVGEKGEEEDHYFCIDCWMAHVRERVANGNPIIRCMERSCDEVLDLNTIRSLVDPAMFRRYSALLKEHFLQTTDDWLWCPATKCDKLIPISPRMQDDDGCATKRTMSASTSSLIINSKSPKQNSLVCSRCAEMFCRECSAEVHWPASCAQYAAYLRVVGANGWPVKRVGNGGSQAGAPSPFLLRVRRCPHCDMKITKGHGCNHVYCKCGEAMCWGCGLKWDSGRHYNCKEKRMEEVVLQDVLKGGNNGLNLAVTGRCLNHRRVLFSTSHKHKLLKLTSERDLVENAVKVFSMGHYLAETCLVWLYANDVAGYGKRKSLRDPDLLEMVQRVEFCLNFLEEAKDARDLRKGVKMAQKTSDQFMGAIRWKLKNSR